MIFKAWFIKPVSNLNLKFLTLSCRRYCEPEIGRKCTYIWLNSQLQLDNLTKLAILPIFFLSKNKIASDYTWKSNQYYSLGKYVTVAKTLKSEQQKAPVKRLNNSYADTLWRCILLLLSRPINWDKRKLPRLVKECHALFPDDVIVSKMS